MTCTEHIRQHLLDNLGISSTVCIPDIKELQKSEWSAEFEKLMRDRLIMGAFRYGLLGDPNKPKWDRLPSIYRRLQEYGATGNDELLVDCANLLLLEFVEGNHPNKHLNSKATGEHVEIKL